jgi:hypothetical protein
MSQNPYGAPAPTQKPANKGGTKGNIVRDAPF